MNGAVLRATCEEATKALVIAFGKSIQAQGLQATETKHKALTGKVRALLVDGRVNRGAPGTQHGRSERLFGMRRGFRGNGGMPQEDSPRVAMATRNSEA